MKNSFLILLGMAIIAIGCKRESNIINEMPITALTVINAVPDSNPLLTGFTFDSTVSTYYPSVQQIGYGAFFEFSVPSGNSPIVIYQVSDTLKPFFKRIVNLQPHGIYSLFIAGDTSNIDTLLTIDTPPYHSSTDSSVGIRFVNLLQGSSPISINIQGNTYASEVGSLAYKNITNFKNYAATSNTNSYVFEVRDAKTDTLVTTYSYTSLDRFKNITVVLSGVNSNNSLLTFKVNNY